MFSSNQRGVVQLFFLLILLAGIIAGLYLVQNTQIFKPKAADLKPSTPETSFTLIKDSSDNLKVNLYARSDIDNANLFVAKIKFPINLLEVSSIQVANGSDPERMCAQVITRACEEANPQNCKDFPTPCSVSVGWVTGSGARGTDQNGFIRNWVEQTYDNAQGTISLVGGVPNPGYKSDISQESKLMATITFRAKAQGEGKIEFDGSSAIYSDSDNLNILSIKRDLDINTGVSVPTPAPSPSSTPSGLTIPITLRAPSGSTNQSSSGNLNIFLESENATSGNASYWIVNVSGSLSGLTSGVGYDVGFCNATQGRCSFTYTQDRIFPNSSGSVTFSNHSLWIPKSEYPNNNPVVKVVIVASSTPLGITACSAYGTPCLTGNFSFDLTPIPSGVTQTRVFVTSTKYGSNFGGLAKADSVCQSLANINNLGGAWRAWLSDRDTNVSSRIGHYSVPYKRLDGVVVADDWTYLTGGTLQNPINKTESNATTTNTAVWTATTLVNNAPHNTDVDCQKWTYSVPVNAPSYDGGVGSIQSYNTSWWTASTAFHCNVASTAAFYCFEQVGSTSQATTSSVPIPVVTITTVKGDANEDGKTDLIDLSILLSDFNKTSDFRTGIDMNEDTQVNSFDFSLMRNLLIQRGIIKS